MKVHVSGNTFVDQRFFDQYYKPSLNNLLSKGAEIYVGGANGIDRLTQQYCLDQSIDPKRVHVYDKGNQDNRLSSEFIHVNEFKTYSDRDEALTNITDQDLCFVHQYGGGGSGTFTNVIRRQFGSEIAKSIQKLFRKHSSEYGNLHDLQLIILEIDK